jgi:outer membrane biosynthesis protein TonB
MTRRRAATEPGRPRGFAWRSQACGGERGSPAASGGADRLLAATIGLSLAGHVAVFAAQLATGGWIELSQPKTPLKLIYQPEPEERSRLTAAADPNRIQVRFQDAPEPSRASGAEALGAADRPATMDLLPADFIPKAALGAGAAGGMLSVTTATGETWSSAVDLTNLAVASQGSPILYSYFGAIREQIQRTANSQAWFQGEQDGGVVYVGFVVDRSGVLQRAGVVAGRSIDSPALREVAVRIIEASSPFLPFPPSFQESSKAIVVPVEFTVAP